jgi:hypothetical protein
MIEGTLYIYFEGFEISIPLFELYKQGEKEETEEKTFQRGIEYLEMKKVPYRTFSQTEKIVYEILV